MKALSLWEPWATLVRRGLKLYETRGWPMYESLIDKPLAIHAAKQPFRPDDWGDELLLQLRADDVSGPWGYGHILCVVHPGRSITTKAWKDFYRTRVDTLADSAVTDKFFDQQIVRFKREFAYGNYADVDSDSGKVRWATPLHDIRVLPEPIPFRGAQGIFNWPEGDAIYQELW